MKKSILFFCLFLLAPSLPGQTGNRMVHYSIEDGLPHNRISSVFQDSRGFIWLATLNGAVLFDGYEFTPYLNGSTENYRVRNSRIVQIAEDHSGRLWFVTYADEVHRLDPFTDRLYNVGEHIHQAHPAFLSALVKVVPSGTVWIASEKNGCARMAENKTDYQLLSVENGGLKGNIIYHIHEDRQGNTWILTDNGLTYLRQGETDPEYFFESNTSSRQRFYSVLERDDEIWFGTDKGHIWRYKKANESFEFYQTEATRAITQLIVGAEGRVVIGTAGDGIFLYDAAGEKNQRLSISGSTPGHHYILSLWKDPYDNVWIQTRAPGIARLDPQEHRIVRYDAVPMQGSEHISDVGFIRIDPEERVWVKLRQGLFHLYDPQKKTLTPVHETRYAPSGDYPSAVTNVFFDRQSNLWICSLKGVDKITFSNHNFQLRKLSDSHATGENDVRALMEDRQGNTWVATKEPKIHVFAPDDTYRGYLCADGTIGSGAPFDGIAYSLYADLSGTVWVGTKGDGLYRLTPEEGRFRVLPFKNDPDDIYSLNNDNLYALGGDARGRIWIGTWGGGLNLLENPNEDEGRFLHHHNELKNYPINQAGYIRHISPPRAGKLFAGTTMGLLVFDVDTDNPQQTVFRLYGQGDSAGKSIINSNIHYVCPGTNGVYLATGGGGISRITDWDEAGFPAGFQSYTRKDGLPSDNILSIAESAGGNLWICSEENITRFDPAAETFRNFDETKKLIRNGLISESSVLFSRRTGKMTVGYSQGIITVHPDELVHSTYVPQIVFTRFRLSNRDVPVGEHSVLPRHVDQMDRIQLSHKDNVFSVIFAAIDYTASENIKYAYRLEGFDPDWNYADKQRTAGYMNLPPGEYTLRVRSTNADGTWVDNERQLVIDMRPSFWQTGWANVLYVLIILLIISAGTYILNTIFRLKNEVRMEARLAEMKLGFFTDISHEIRTPLTLITAPVDHLLHDEHTPEPIRRQLGFVSRNTDRMLRMINQILDLRKAQDGTLHCEQFALGEFVGVVCRSFHAQAVQQQIDFTCEDCSCGALVWADRDAVEKIVYNLLSNAFKFTDSGKSIRVSLHVADQRFRLEVQDEGKGMQADQLPRIFDRFFTIDSSENKSSSGIGLSMVKELIGKHNGEIRVDSSPGRGTTFTVWLKTGPEQIGETVNNGSTPAHR